jgi:hypothetical protein
LGVLEPVAPQSVVEPLLLAERVSAGKRHIQQGFKRFRRTNIMEEGCMVFAYHASPGFTSANQGDHGLLRIQGGGTLVGEYSINTPAPAGLLNKPEYFEKQRSKGNARRNLAHPGDTTLLTE